MRKNTWENIVKPIVVLGTICVVTSTLLAVTNEFTAPIIKERQDKAAFAAYGAVLPDADGFTRITDFATSNVTEVVKADNGAGYAMKAVGKGFGGEVPVIIGFDAEGNIIGVQFLQNEESAGYGMRLWDSTGDGAKFAEELKGKSGSVALGQDGVNGLSGATVSSNAVISAVNSAINCFNEVALGQSAVVEEELPATLDAAVEKMLGEAPTALDAPEGAEAVYTNAAGDKTVVTASAKGFSGETAPLMVAVCFDGSGAITGVWVDVSGQTEGLGSRTAEPEFTDKFLGLADEAGVQGVDAIASVTETSDGVKAGVTACLKAYQAMKGGN